MKLVQEQMKKTPELKAGQTVKVYQRVKEGNKERIQPFEGLVIAVKHGKGLDGTFTVRKIAEGVGVERTYLRHSPTIEKIEILKTSKVRRAKLYYMRERFGKRARMKSNKRIEVPASATSQEEAQVA